MSDNNQISATTIKDGLRKRISDGLIELQIGDIYRHSDHTCEYSNSRRRILSFTKDGQVIYEYWLLETPQNCIVKMAPAEQFCWCAELELPN